MRGRYTENQLISIYERSDRDTNNRLDYNFSGMYLTENQQRNKF